MSDCESINLIVDRQGNWQSYVSAMPPGYTAVGTVQRQPDGEGGALLRRDADGVYVQAKGVVVTLLPQGVIVAALAELDALGRGVGRPPAMEKGARKNVYLDAESLRLARALGNGNVSEGLRKALRIAMQLPDEK